MIVYHPTTQEPVTLLEEACAYLLALRKTARVPIKKAVAMAIDYQRRLDAHVERLHD